MKYLYALGVVSVLGAGIAFSLYFDKQPQSVTKIAYSQYKAPQDFAEAFAVKLKKPLSEASIALLGVTPGRRQDLEFWKAFLENSKNPAMAYPAIVIDPKLPFAAEVFPGAVKLDLKNEMARFAEGAKNAQAQGIRMVVIAPTIYTAQIISENPVNLLIAKEGLQPTSFSMVAFPRKSSDELDLEPTCKVGDQNKEGTGALGCAIQSRARPLYRTPADPAKYEGLVDQLGERDYLVFWNPPQLPTPEKSQKN
jgi:hypothetical protein